MQKKKTVWPPLSKVCLKTKYTGILLHVTFDLKCIDFNIKTDQHVQLSCCVPSLETASSQFAASFTGAYLNGSIKAKRVSKKQKFISLTRSKLEHSWASELMTNFKI